MATELLKTRVELREWITNWRLMGRTIGLVPTMGALHAGHLTLVRQARAECDAVVVTIFVNPMQFGPGEDFSRYPRTLEADLALLADAQVDCVFAPSTEEMVSAGASTLVDVGAVAVPWEGAHRPGHFRGVATIVLKLFNLVMPDVAYFGQKDYQQSLVIRRLVADLDLPVDIRIASTVREPDGLAMSSRNRYLSADQRQRALALSRALGLAKQLATEGTRDVATILARMREVLASAQVEIDYLALVDPDTLVPREQLDRPTVALIAARVGATRLIDNELIEPGQS